MLISFEPLIVAKMLKIFCLVALFCSPGHAAVADFFDLERDLSISHAKVKPFYGCETTAFPPNESSLVPTYTIDLALQPRQRWTELVLANKEALVAMVGHVYNLTESVMGETAVRFLLKHLGKITDSLPHVYREELEGIAETSGLELDQIIFYNIFYEIFSFCTSIVMQDPHGEIYHGRNLDFGLFLGWNNATHEWRVAELLRPLVAQLEWRNSTSVVYTSVTFAGYIGVVTANKPGVFSFSVNERFSWNGGYVGLVEWMLFGDHNQSWLALLTREVLLEAVSYEDAVKRLSTPRLVAPVYFTLAGTRPGEGCIITRYRDNYDLLKLGSEGYLSTWYLVQTNYDHWNKPPFFDDRRTPAATCLDGSRNSSVRSDVGQHAGAAALLSELQSNSQSKPRRADVGGAGDREKMLDMLQNDSIQNKGDPVSGVGGKDETESLGDKNSSGVEGVLEFIKRGAFKAEDAIARYWHASLQKIRHLIGQKDGSNNQTSSEKPIDSKRTREVNMVRERVVRSPTGRDRFAERFVDNRVSNDTAPLSLLYNVLSTRPVLNKLTTYTTLMSAKKGYIKSWLRQCADPCWPW